jgi:hypothetical protein
MVIDGGASSHPRAHSNSNYTQHTENTEKQPTQLSLPGGGSRSFLPSPSSSSSGDSSSCQEEEETGSNKDFFPLLVDYCPGNPCITALVHRLHKDVLEGVEGADVQLNRYLVVCSFIIARGREEEDSAPDSCDSSRRSSSDRKQPAQGTACIVLDCMCGDPAHAVHMSKPMYKQQFKLWCRSSFVHNSVPGCSADGGGVQGSSSSSSCKSKPLHIPLASLITPVHNTLQFSLLPDLGYFMRMVLQKRYFSDQSRKHWTKAASNYQVLGGFVPLSSEVGGLSSGGAGNGDRGSQAPSFSKPLPTPSASETVDVAESAKRIASASWGAVNGLCTTLLQDSIPCLRRSKRTTNYLSMILCESDKGSGNSAKGHLLYNPVIVAACVNVLFGTLLKLYNLGAKTPTFKSRVAMTSRLMQLSCSSTDEQVVCLVFGGFLYISACFSPRFQVL